MKPLPIALGLLVALAVPAAQAQTPPASCTFAAGSGLLTQNEGEATITCTGVNEAAARQFADILTRILQNRVDPQGVLAKLDEVDRIPEDNAAARTLSDDQRHAIVQSLAGKPAAKVAITAHPLADDSADFAQALAMPLVMVGWEIEGNQIRRRATKELDPVPGLALVVRDRKAPPPNAAQLKAAFAAAHITAPYVADPSVAPDAVLLWIGRRPAPPPVEAPK